LLRDGRLQQPEYAFPAAALLVLLAFIPGLIWVAIDNRTEQEVSVDGKPIPKGGWITGTDARVDKLRDRYCVSEPSRSTGRFLDLFLPRALVTSPRPTWDALGGSYTPAQRKTLEVDAGGRTVDGDPEVLFDADESCKAPEGVTAMVKVEDATIRIPYNRRLLREVTDGVAALTLEDVSNSPDVEDANVLVTSAGTLGCKAMGHVPLDEYVAKGAKVLALVTKGPGRNSSSWKGEGERAWLCAREKVDETQLTLATAGGPVDIVLPTNPGRSSVELDGVRLICHPEVGRIWRIMRLPLAAGSKVPDSAVRFGTAAEATLVVTDDRFAVICASNEMESSFVTADYRITIADEVAIAARPRPTIDRPRPPDIQPIKAPERFCYYVKAQSPTGPCRGDRCPSGCKETRDPLKKAGALRGCSRVCACVAAPSCEP
jgi:hypothetical protein